jgi:GT2 family glycosyltransferase
VAALHEQLILINNGAKLPETKKILDAAKVSGHTVVELPDHGCFSKSINAGLQVSKGEHICIMNDDVYVNDAWDSQMLMELSDSRIGMIGARMPGHAAGFMGDPTYADILPVNFLVFAHVMMRREVFEKVGMLDSETFDGYGSEDLDYCWRIVKAGWKLAVSKASVFHVGGASMVNKLGGSEGRANEYARMQRKLVEKWGEDHCRAGTKMYPRVALAIPTYTGKVDNDFLQSVATLDKTGPFQLEIFQSKRLVVHYAREKIAERIVEEGFDYIWWLDDDMVFPPDTLTRLLAHQKPFVSALAYQRKEPYHTCLFDWIDIKTAPEGGSFQSLNNIENTGLRKIAASGSACVLVSTEIFKKTKDKRPWFSNKVFGEDMAFCKLATDNGYQIYGDTDLIIGHIGDPIVVDEAHVARYKMRQQQDAERLQPKVLVRR